MKTQLPHNEVEKIKRLKIVREALNLTQGQMAEILGIPRPNLSSIENLKEKRNVPKDTHYILENQFNVNREWFVSGEGEMFTKSKNLLSEPVISYDHRIPMYDSPATASEVEVYNDMVQASPAFSVSIPQFRDCNFGKMIYGHSMYPTIESGTYVFCKEVSDKQFFIPGEIYYIEVDNFSMCKRLKHSDKIGYAVAISDNEEAQKDGSRKFESFPIELDKIRHLYLVKGYFKQTQN